MYYNILYYSICFYFTSFHTARRRGTALHIIVYCSIGVRSEDIGEKLKELGYTKILNLYGGIFDWKNKGGN